MEYNFNELSPVKFQRLINSILVARFGENVRMTPLRGQDGGRDGETAPGHPYFEFQVSDVTQPPEAIVDPPRKGRYLFQVKHHRTTDKRLSDARQAVISDFSNELKINVLCRKGEERVNYFFLVTNVPASKEALLKVDGLRHRLLKRKKNLHADVWWQEQIIAYLDRMPTIWSSFPEMFAGGQVPLLVEVVSQAPGTLPRAVRLAISRQYDRDRNVKFRQIELEQNLSKLFVDLDVNCQDLTEEEYQQLTFFEHQYLSRYFGEEFEDDRDRRLYIWQLSYRARRARYDGLVSALGLLLDRAEKEITRKIILEGGPGQGKSTITQMVVQIYRQKLLEKQDIDPEGRWTTLQRLRLPFRIELREFGEWLTNNPDSSVEQYLSYIITRDSGGAEVSIDDIHSFVKNSPVLLIFDGLDEVGSDSLRNGVINAILECTNRFENGLGVDLRVVVTSRPPGMTGRRERLKDFRRFTIAPMDNDKVESYVDRWLSVQIQEDYEKERIRGSFERRRRDPHVKVLAQNPMQLSVLLQFIRLKGEAFPDRRAELYRDYFQIVIDRDVEKSPELRKNREVIEALHEYLGYKIHSLTEVNQADRTLERTRLINMVEEWLRSRRDRPEMASRFFKLGEERFGLIVAPAGEGQETRYGFEVQPVQEYFSAAFISNQIEPSCAHEVFQEMLRRSYWKEVALFLAGLRRRNEKADLVARARQLDQEKALGWRQDGRAVILQLLQEGVLSEPPSVFSLAMEFVLDLLDPKKVNIQREPQAMLSILTNMVKQDDKRAAHQQLRTLLQEYNNCQDQYILYRLYRIANQSLHPDEIRGYILSCRDQSPDLTAKLRLVWPNNNGININELARDPSFWQGVPASIWAEAWWNMTLRSGSVLDIPAPATIHQRLVEQFATNPISFSYYYIRRAPKFLGFTSNWAVWRLLSQQQILHYIIFYRNIREAPSNKFLEQLDQIMSEGVDNSVIDFDGLDKSTFNVVKDLIEQSRILIKAMVTEESHEKTAKTEYIRALRRYLEQPGLTSWLACRCAKNLIPLFFDGIEPWMLSRSSLRRFLKSDEEELYFIKDILQFFLDPISMNLDDTSSVKRALDILAREMDIGFMLSPHRRQLDLVPRYIRLGPGSQPVAIIDLLAKSIYDESDLPYDWMKNIPFSTEIIRPLVERCRDCLPNLLVEFSEMRFSHIGIGKPLVVQDTQRILKIARRTDDPKILAGALIALSTSRFLRIPETGLILKLINIDSCNARFAVQLFNRFSMGEEVSDIEIDVIREVAAGVFRTPDSYSFEIVCAAAEFLAEFNPPSLKPLLFLQDDLGIS